MNVSGRPFEMDELRGEDPMTDPDAGEAWAMGRELAALATERPASDSEGVDPQFVARVMASVEREPQPRPISGYGRAALALRPSGILASLRDAWRVAYGPGRPVRERVAALGYVLAVGMLVMALSGVGLAGTAALLGPQAIAPATSAPVTPMPTDNPNGWLATPRPDASLPVSSAQPEASAGPLASPTPLPTGAAGSEDDDRSPSAFPSPSQEAEETPTLRPSTMPASSPGGTPRPSSSGGGGETPRPTSSSG